MKTLVIAATWLMLATPATAKNTHVYGPPPDWQRYKQLGEAAVRQALPVGDWIIEWPNGYMKAGRRYRGDFGGYVTCGSVRTASPPPGFYSLTQFAIVIDHDQVQVTEISSRADNSHVNNLCRVLVKRGMLPPPPREDAPPDLIVASLGLTIRPMPAGAYIISVVPPTNGADKTAGTKLSAGMVVTRVNGIPLAGMGSAMAGLLGSNANHLKLEIATGEHIVIEQ